MDLVSFKSEVRLFLQSEMIKQKAVVSESNFKIVSSFYKKSCVCNGKTKGNIFPERCSALVFMIRESSAKENDINLCQIQPDLLERKHIALKVKKRLV